MEGISWFKPICFVTVLFENAHHTYFSNPQTLQAESDSDDQTTDQAVQAKMKNAFVSQNVSSLQELGQ